MFQMAGIDTYQQWFGSVAYFFEVGDVEEEEVDDIQGGTRTQVGAESC